MSVIVEGGQKAGFHLDAQLLHLGGVEAEIMAGQWTYTDQLALALEHIDEHGKFIEPYLAHPATPEIDTVVIGELAAGLQTTVFVEIGLQVLAVAVHGAELVDTYNFAVLADTAQLDKGGAGGNIVPDGGLLFTSKDKKLALAELFIEHLETGTVHSTEHLDTVVGAALAFGDGHIQAASGFAELGANTMPEIMKGEDKVADAPRVFLHDELALEYGGAAVAPQVAAGGEVLVGAVEEGVEVLHLVEGLLAEEDLGVDGIVLGETVALVGIDDDGGGGELFAVFFHPCEGFLETHVAGLDEDAAHVGVVDLLGGEAGAVVGSALGVVVGDLWFVVEGDSHIICGVRTPYGILYLGVALRARNYSKINFKNYSKINLGVCFAQKSIKIYSKSYRICAYALRHTYVSARFAWKLLNFILLFLAMAMFKRACIAHLA